MKTSYGLFQRFGVELEYMMVDAETLAIRPEADWLIQKVSGSLEEDVSRGRLDWSNELALHLIEMKTGRPVNTLAGLAEGFQGEVTFINRILAESGMRLLPTAMHPWMNPERESRLWPHSCGEIYAAFDRIFNCSGHGWTNLQATHLNLPFRTAGEFRRLHTAIRLLLPLLPVLAASSPFMEGRRAPVLDMRLQVYRDNCRRIPSVTGRVVPEPMESPAQYRREILRRIYRDLAPHDPDEILREEWANARGAIARFERNTIEIRVLDIQECPRADLAILQGIVAVLRALTDQKLSTTRAQLALPTEDLRRLLTRTIRAGRGAILSHGGYLEALGLAGVRRLRAGEVWSRLLDAAGPARAPWRDVLGMILEEGNLSERILRATGEHPSRRRLRTVYGRLADCLARGQLFHA